MTSNPDVRQQLWEFIYDLLSPEETAALEQQITSDPEIARAYAEVKLQSEFVKSALHHSASPIPLTRTAAEPRSASTTKTRSRHSASPTSSSGAAPPARTLRQLYAMALAASLLLAAGYWMMRESTFPSLTELAVQHPLPPPRLTVLAPSPSHPEIASSFSLQTRNLSGQPTSTGVDVIVRDDQESERWRASVQTDSAGMALVSIPAMFHEPSHRLEFHVAEGEGILDPLVAPLATRPVSLATHLATDRTNYRPGDTLQFRSATLPRPSIGPLSETRVAFEVLSPDRQPLHESRQEAVTSQGVAHGEFVLGDDLVEGRYQLVASSPEGKFPPVSQDFLVGASDDGLSESPSAWQIDLAWSQSRYLPGDEVIADVEVRDHWGQPLPEQLLEVSGMVDEKAWEIGPSPVVTSVDGTAQVRAELPDDLRVGTGEWRIGMAKAALSREASEESEESEESEDRQDRHERHEKFPVPIQVPRLHVQWVPEGGPLVAGLPNQVYFTALDSRGEPLELEGEIRDSEGNRVTRIATARPGLGKFSFTPRAGTSYELAIQSLEQSPEQSLEQSPEQSLEKSPERWQVAAEPLVAVSHEGVSLEVHSPVISPGEPITLNLHDHPGGRALAVVAYAQDVEVGRTVVVTPGNGRSQPVTLSLEPLVAGVHQLRVFEFSGDQQAPRLLAQRPVFQRPEFSWELSLLEKAPLATEPSRRHFALEAFRESHTLSPDNIARRNGETSTLANSFGLPPMREDFDAELDDASQLTVGFSITRPTSARISEKELGGANFDSAAPIERMWLSNFFHGLTDLAPPSSFVGRRLRSDWTTLEEEELGLLLSVVGWLPRERAGQWAGQGAGQWVDLGPLALRPPAPAGPGAPMAQADSNDRELVELEHRAWLGDAFQVEPSQDLDSPQADLLAFAMPPPAGAPQVHDNLEAIRAWERAWRGEVAAARVEKQAGTRQLIGKWLVGFSLLALVGLGAVSLYRLGRSGVWLPPLAVATTLVLAVAWLGMRPAGEFLADRHIAMHSSKDGLEADRATSSPRFASPQPSGRARTEPDDGMMAASEPMAASEMESMSNWALSSDSEMAEEMEMAEESDLAAESSLAFPLAAPTETPPDRMARNDRPSQRSRAMGGGMGGGLAGRGAHFGDDSPAIARSEPLSRLPGEGLGLPESSTPLDRRLIERGREGSSPRILDREQVDRSYPATWHWVPNGTEDTARLRTGEGASPVLVDVPETERGIDVVIWAHSPTSRQEIRRQIPLSRLLSVEWMVPEQLALGDELHAPLLIRNDSTLPRDVALQFSVAPHLSLLSDEEDKEVEEQEVESAQDGGEARLQSNDMQVLSLSARIEPESTREISLPRLRADKPGEAMVELNWKVPASEASRVWWFDIAPPLPAQVREEAGTITDRQPLAFGLHPPRDDQVLPADRVPAETETETETEAETETETETAAEAEADGRTATDGMEKVEGYLHLHWRGYPSLAAELQDAVATLDRGENLLAEFAGHARWSRGIPADRLGLADPRSTIDSALADPPVSEGVPFLESPDSRADVAPRNWEATGRRLNEWLDHKQVAAPHLRRWSEPWRGNTTISSGEMAEQSARMPESVDPQRLRETRLPHGGWSTPQATIEAIERLTADATRPPFATAEHQVELLGHRGDQLAAVTLPAGSMRPLVLEGWWPVELSATEVEQQQVTFQQIHRGEKAIPYVSRATLYSPRAAQVSSADNTLRLGTLRLGTLRLGWLDSSGEALSHITLTREETVTLFIDVLKPVQQSLVVRGGIPAGLQLSPSALEQLLSDGMVTQATLDRQDLTLVFPPEGGQVSEPPGDADLENEGQARISLRLELQAATPGKFRGPPSRWALDPAGPWQFVAQPLEVEILREGQSRESGREAEK